MPSTPAYGIIDRSLTELISSLAMLSMLCKFDERSAGLYERIEELRQRIITEDKYLRARFALPKVRDDGESEFSAEDKGPMPVEELSGQLTKHLRASQELCRTLEEYFRFFGLNPVAVGFKRGRYELYEIERESNRLLGPAVLPVKAETPDVMASANKIKRALVINPFYFILDESICANRDPLRLAFDAVGGGIRMLQVRLKSYTTRELVDLSTRLRRVCSERDCLLIINDRLDIAMATHADGVHVGSTDLSVPEIRKLAPDMLIGVTVRKTRDAVAAEESGADYLGVGSVFPSKTKSNLPIIGIRGLVRIASRTSIPIAAIGGITLENCREVITAGAAGFCSIKPFGQKRSAKNLVAQFRRVAKGEEVYSA